MNPLHTLRNTPWLARLALLWFALTLGMAVAAPVLSGDKPVTLCTTGGMVKLVLNDDGSTSSAPAALDCPLCAVGGAPAPVMLLPSEPPRALCHTRQGIPAAPVASLSSAPLPARGPPIT